MNARLKSLDASAALVDAAVAKAISTPDGVVLTRGSDIKPEAVDWLWGDWLARGKLAILAGPPGQGKTTIAMAMVATVTSGGKWPDATQCDQGTALIWSGEDDPSDTLVPRLMAAGADLSRVWFVTGSRVNGEVLPFDPSRDLVQLTAKAHEIGDVHLLVVDPVVSAVGGDSHKNTEVRRGLQPLVDLGLYLNAAVLGISHFSKGSAGRDPTERVTGSVAFGAVARVVMVADRVKNEDGDEERRILARSKSNIGPDDGGFEYGLKQFEALPGISASCVMWGKAITGTARELLTIPEKDCDDEAGSIAHDAADALVRIIGRDLVPRSEVMTQMKAEGFSDKMIRSGRERLRVTVQRSGFGKQMSSYWKLPENARLPADDAIHAPKTALMPTHAQAQSRAAMGTTAVQRKRSENGDGEVEWI